MSHSSFSRPLRNTTRPIAAKIRRLTDLTPDPQNANRGTDRGRAALERSLREYGAGRAVLIDRHGRIIAGHKTIEQAKRLNIRLRVVKTDGQHLVAVQRDDLDLATDPRALAGNTSGRSPGQLSAACWTRRSSWKCSCDGVRLWKC